MLNGRNSTIPITTPERPAVSGVTPAHTSKYRTTLGIGDSDRQVQENFLEVLILLSPAVYGWYDAKKYACDSIAKSLYTKFPVLRPLRRPCTSKVLKYLSGPSLLHRLASQVLFRTKMPRSMKYNDEGQDVHN